MVHRGEAPVAVPGGRVSSLGCGVALGLLFAVPLGASSQKLGRASGHGGEIIEYEVVADAPTTLVFVHGWMCDRSFWREQRSHFAARLGVVLLDLGGHGASGASRDEWTIESFAGDVMAVLESLDLRDAILVGHSMGGPVVAEVALRAPERVRAVVGVDTYQYVGARWLQGQGVATLVAPLKNDFRGTAAGWVRDMFTSSSDPALVQAVLEGMIEGPPTVGVPATESMFTWYRDRAVEVLRAIEQPLWTINSSEYVGTNVAALRSNVPGIEVRIVDGVGHFVMLEAPESFNRALDEVLAAILGTA